MRKKINIVRAEEKDLETILQLQKDCYWEEAKFYQDWSIPPLSQDLNSLRKESEQNILLKAEIEGQIVASVRGFVDDNNTCHVGRLMVAKEFQNKGFGQLMVNALELAFEHCSRFELFTGYRSEKNLHLYHKLGYTEFKRERVNERITLVYLEKQNDNNTSKPALLTTNASS